jgi:hypothetical protein
MQLGSSYGRQPGDCTMGMTAQYRHISKRALDALRQR